MSELRAEAMLNASYIRANITSMMRARAYFTHALEVDEEHYVARHNLAFMANSARNFTDAREHLEMLLVKQVARDVDVIHALKVTSCSVKFTTTMKTRTKP